MRSSELNIDLALSDFLTSLIAISLKIWVACQELPCKCRSVEAIQLLLNFRRTPKGRWHRRLLYLAASKTRAKKPRIFIGIIAAGSP